MIGRIAIWLCLKMMHLPQKWEFHWDADDSSQDFMGFPDAPWQLCQLHRCAKKSSFRGWWRCPQCLVTRNAENRKIDMRRSKSNEQWQTIHLLPHFFRIILWTIHWHVRGRGQVLGEAAWSVVLMAQSRRLGKLRGSWLGDPPMELTPAFSLTWRFLSRLVKGMSNNKTVDSWLKTVKISYWLYMNTVYIYGWSCQSLCCQGSFRRLRDMRRYIYIYSKIDSSSTEGTPFHIVHVTRVISSDPMIAKKPQWMKVGIDVDEVLQFPASQNPQL